TVDAQSELLRWRRKERKRPWQRSEARKLRRRKLAAVRRPRRSKNRFVSLVGQGCPTDRWFDSDSLTRSRGSAIQMRRATNAKLKPPPRSALKASPKRDAFLFRH